MSKRLQPSHKLSVVRTVWVLRWRVDISLQHATGRLVVLAGELSISTLRWPFRRLLPPFPSFGPPAAVGRTEWFHSLASGQDIDGVLCGNRWENPLMWSKGP